ncbi:hypothetical protein [Streptomyces shenzhenensis]|uniref:hypothetical protein n=1 Tax=Streptomyces shenzhenensis TaxID=943815 RepID=UPI0011C44A6D|nr:hypothetical protein [Streptomyces shenzhenensis]
MTKTSARMSFVTDGFKGFFFLTLCCHFFQQRQMGTRAEHGALPTTTRERDSLPLQGYRQKDKLSRLSKDLLRGCPWGVRIADLLLVILPLPAADPEWDRKRRGGTPILTHRKIFYLLQRHRHKVKDSIVC